MHLQRDSVDDGGLQNNLVSASKELRLLFPGDCLLTMSVLFAPAGHGFKFGPLIGKIMADLATVGDCPDVPLHRFAISRFKGKPPELPRGEELAELLAKL
jgi:hypothetical protein